jgi:hypothetical protein
VRKSPDIFYFVLLIRFFFLRIFLMNESYSIFIIYFFVRLLKQIQINITNRKFLYFSENVISSSFCFVFVLYFFFCVTRHVVKIYYTKGIKLSVIESMKIVSCCWSFHSIVFFYLRRMNEKLMFYL